MCKPIYFKKCPRCNEYGFEYLKTYGYCVNCLYTTEDNISIMPLGQVIIDLKDMGKEKSKKKQLTFNEKKCA